MSRTGTPSWLKLLIQNSVAPLGTLLLITIVYQQTNSFGWAMVALVIGTIVSIIVAMAANFNKWGFRKKYLKHLINRHQDFDVKGLTTQGIYNLELEMVFVELRIDPNSLHLVSTELIQEMPQKFRKGNHTIWEFLEANSMHQQNLAVIGTPGSGKTTLFKHMALTLARRKKKLPNKLPILIFLREYAETIQENIDLPLSEVVKHDLERWNLPSPSNWFEGHLQNGACLVLLDGLDEVPDAKIRKTVADWIEKQMKIYADNQFIISSRPHGYISNPLSGVTTLEVRPFSRKQVNKFVSNWYLANEIKSMRADNSDVRLKAQKDANNLLNRLFNASALSELAVNPLLLTMIATVHRFRGTLPERRVSLYAEIFEVILGKRQQEAKRLELVLTSAEKQHLLEELAYDMMFWEIREVNLDDAHQLIGHSLNMVSNSTTTADFLSLVEDSSGLLVEVESGIYGFSHRTFQEYLAACYIKKHALIDELKDFVGESWWHETIRLYAAQADATPIINACIPIATIKPEALTLAVQCLEEAEKVDPKVSKRLRNFLDMGVEDDEPRIRKVVAKALLNLRFQQMSQIDDMLHVDNSLITHAEYQLFLDEKRLQGEYCQPDHWKTYRFPRGMGKLPVVGVRSTDADTFCNWLTLQDEGVWQYRLLWELETISHPLDSEDKDGSYWIFSGNNHVLKIRGDKPRISKTWLDNRFDLARAKVSALTLDHKGGLPHANARDLDLVRSLARDLDLARDHAFDRALDLARTRDLTRDRDFNFAYAFNLDLKQTLNLARSLILSFDRSLIPSFDRAFQHVFDFARTLTLTFNLASTHTLDLEQAFELILERNLELDKEKAQGCRIYIRAMSLTIVDLLHRVIISKEKHRPWAENPRQESKEKELMDEIQSLIDNYLDLYLDFAILEGRIEGELPAVEGIRIVRERREE